MNNHDFSARVLITSALPYISERKHLGNLIGSMLPADVYARYLRATNKEVLFICATDEHGTPAELAAAKANMNNKEFCDKAYQILADICEKFCLSFNHFGRTSHNFNHELTQLFATDLKQNGYIEEREIEIIYSIDDKRSLPDRYVEGTCPYCNYEKARGDQCENCSSVLDPTDLIEPKSAISGSKNLILQKSNHLFLKQSLLINEIKKWIDLHPNWPVIVKGIANSWIKKGLSDRCITRDLSWGVPVNFPGYENKVFYVWFDAPIGYISATKEWANKESERDWKKWWLPESQNNVHYVQFMAKDNIPFHTVMFPATILGTKKPWKTVDYIKGFNWLNYYGGKFSTSQKRGIFMDDAISLYPADYWRYYLMKNIPENHDVDFTWDSFAKSVNNDLADVFGNFAQRSIKMIEKHFNFHIPTEGINEDNERNLAVNIQTLFEVYKEGLEKLNFKQALDALRNLWVQGNIYFDLSAPWLLIKQNKNKAAVVLRNSINLLAIYAILSEPILPNTSKLLRNCLLKNPNDFNIWPESFVNEKTGLLEIIIKEKITPPGILFKKIDESEVANFEKIYGSGEVV